MSRYNYDFSDLKLQRYIKEGRGQGRGVEYEPWLNVHSIASRGRVSRVHGWKTGRVHHFLTDNEVRYFYHCEWSDIVVDIREHFPLLDLYEMTEVLDENLMKKLIDRKSGTPHILTTTFLVTVRNEQGQETHFARSIKEAREFEKKAVIERYEAIRRYWKAKGISWALVTPNEINGVSAKNIEWVHTARKISDWGYAKEQAEAELFYLMEVLNEGEQTIRSAIEQFEKYIQCEQGRGLLFFKHLLATKRIQMDMKERLDLNLSTKTIKVSDLTKGSELLNYEFGS